MTGQQIINLLKSESVDRKDLFDEASKVKKKYIGDIVYLRGLIEFSNQCQKDCLYCGIRKSNHTILRYQLTDEEILDAVDFALKNKFGSIVLQSGEIRSKSFTDRITRLLKSIQTLANDLIWMNDMDVDMIGLGPYLEHTDIPLHQYSDSLWSKETRFDLSLKAIAILRILMKDVNIAASTAMQAIDKLGREKAIKAGANVFMPNITPGFYRDYYKLYDHKSCTAETVTDCRSCIDVRISLTGNKVAYGEWGDSKHYLQKRT